ncbi:MAG: chloride channel protein [Pseudomonadales bacterium]
MTKPRKPLFSALLHHTLSKPLSYAREKIASNDALLSISFLGILAGVLAATAILTFRWAIDLGQTAVLPNGTPEDFESLSELARFALPAGGGLLLGLIMLMINRSYHSVGVAHVIHTTNNLHGDLPIKNVVFQFFAGIIAIVTGQSGGREGPAVHLGAGVTSWAAQALHLPHNSSRILISCGTAAAIAASFNTPIAGVIFAMEVVMLEYTIAGFTPVILAAIVATLMSRASFGSEPMFLIDVVQMTSFNEVFFVAIIGIACGCVAATFVAIQKFCLRWSKVSAIWRLSVAGLFTGIIAIFVPEVLGMGYDTLALLLRNEVVGTALVAIVVCKLLVTAVSCGLGMPLGFIGPALIIGAGVGSLLGTIGLQVQPDVGSDIGLYILLGMGAMMAAILNAPLAALLAIVELTNSAYIMLPGMLAIISATLTSNGVFGQNSAQHATLLSQGFRIQSDPLSQALQRASVSSLMDRNFRHVAHVMTYEQVEKLLENRPRWLLLSPPESSKQLVDSTDLVLHMEELTAEIAKLVDNTDSDDTDEKHQNDIALLELAGKQRVLADIQPQATLREALETMNATQADALYVSAPPMALYVPPSGIITRDDIENYYRHPQRPGNL